MEKLPVQNQRSYVPTYRTTEFTINLMWGNTMTPLQNDRRSLQSWKLQFLLGKSMSLFDGKKKLLKYLLYWNTCNFKIITILIIDSQLAFDTTGKFANILCVSRDWREWQKNKIVLAEELTFCCQLEDYDVTEIARSKLASILKIRCGQRRQLQHYRSNYLYNRLDTYNIELP